MKIAFVYYPRSSFVKQDLASLSRHFQIEVLGYKSPRDVFQMIGPIRRSDLMFSWFASGHSFAAVLFCKLLRKRSVVVAGATMWPASPALIMDSIPWPGTRECMRTMF